MNEPLRHHFLPVFYLKNWGGSGGRLVEFSVPYRNIVKPKRVHPKGTGYIDRLYAIEGLPGQISVEIEKNFLSPVDSRAAAALAALKEKTALSKENRNAWSHFVMTLLVRMPTEITLLKEVAKNIESDISSKLKNLMIRHVPSQYHSEIQKAASELEVDTISRTVGHIIELLSSDDIAERISAMYWDSIDLSSGPHELLTSDRPVVVVRNDNTAGQTVIALPIGPRTLFVAATKKELIDELKRVPPKKVSEAMNTELVSGASNYVYASNDSQLKFIQKRFGQNKSQSFVADIFRKAGFDVSAFAEYLRQFNDDDFRLKIETAISEGENKRNSMRLLETE